MKLKISLAITTLALIGVSIPALASAQWTKLS